MLRCRLWSKIDTCMVRYCVIVNPDFNCFSLQQWVFDINLQEIANVIPTAAVKQSAKVLGPLVIIKEHYLLSIVVILNSLFLKWLLLQLSETLFDTLILMHICWVWTLILLIATCNICQLNVYDTGGHWFILIINSNPIYLHLILCLAHVQIMVRISSGSSLDISAVLIVVAIFARIPVLETYHSLPHTICPFI